MVACSQVPLPKHPRLIASLPQDIGQRHGRRVQAAVQAMRRMPESAAALQTALRLDPGSAVIETNLRLALAKQGDYRRAAAGSRDEKELAGPSIM